MLTKNEFNQVDALYQECFGESSIPTVILEHWFHQQPEGIIHLQKKEEFVGALSFWYISEYYYQQFVTGKIAEKGLPINEINPTDKHFIYISEIALQAAGRKQGNAFKLLEVFVERVEQRAKDIYPFSILAMGYSDAGINLLMKVGFVQILDSKQNINEMPLLELQAESRDKLVGILKM